MARKRGKARGPQKMTYGGPVTVKPLTKENLEHTIYHRFEGEFPDEYEIFDLVTHETYPSTTQT
jgi:hypothetical protein